MSNRGGRSSGRLCSIAYLIVLLMTGGNASAAVDIDSGGLPTQASPQGSQEQSSDRFSIHWQAT